MADRQDSSSLKGDCVAAFKSGNKRVAEQLQTRIKPAFVRTTFQTFSDTPRSIGNVSLLHLAAYWGWKDVAVCLVAVHNCSAMWKDKKGSVPLLYAAYKGHLEVVKYFIAELHCDPMGRGMGGNTQWRI